MLTLLNVKRIRTLRYKSAQFAIIFLYFSSKNQAGQQVYALIKCELHLFNGFQANILVGNNILSLEGFAIDINKNCAPIGCCGVIIAINIRQRKYFFRRKLLTSNKNVILPRSKSMIFFVPVFLPNDRIFLFHPITQVNLTLYTHIVNYTILGS